MEKKCRSGSYVAMTLTAIALALAFTVPSALAAEPIMIGFTGDFSGSNAASGVQALPAIEVVVKEVNAAGGINGRQIKLITQDNGSDPAKAIGNVKMFKEQYHVKAIVANTTSGVAIALRGWAEKNQIPIISANPQSDKLWVREGKAWLLRVTMPASPRVEAALAKLKQLGYTSVAFEGATTAWGTDTLAEVKAKAPKYGIKVVAEVLVEPKTKDLTIQAKQLKDSGAKALIVAEYDAEGAGLARAMNYVDYKPFVIHTSAANLSESILHTDPAFFEGWSVLQEVDPTKPEVINVWKKIKDHTGKAPIENEEGPRAWDSMALLIEAIKAGGNPEDSVAIRDGFYKIKDYKWVFGRQGSKGGFKEGKNHLLDIDDLVEYNVRNGKLVRAK